MAWLTREAEVLAAVERGARGRLDRGPERVVVLRRPLVLHARPSWPLDVAWCRPRRDAALRGAGETGGAEAVEVARMRTLSSRLPAPPGWRCPVVIVAPGGAFERWHLGVGDRLEISGD